MRIELDQSATVAYFATVQMKRLENDFEPAVAVLSDTTKEGEEE